jgi:iron complex transport system substrate-binding protein
MNKMIKYIGKFPWAWLIIALGPGLFLALLGPKVEPAMGPESGIAVTDTTGRTIHIEAPAETVFITSPVLWHYLSVNPDEGPVTKIPGYMWGEFRATVLGKIFPGLEGKSAAFTNFGTPSPISVEEVLWTDPDVALVWDYMSFGLELVKFPGLVKVGRDGGDKAKLFGALGALSGQEARVGFLWRRFERERQEVVDDLKGCQNPARIVVIETVSYTFWANPNNSYFSAYVESVCGQNIGQRMPTRNGTLNIEQFLILDPDIIYINPYVLGDTDIKVWEILDDPRFQGLKAVKAKRVYHMPLGASRLEGPVEAALSMLWFRMTMHPFKSTSLDIREKIWRTYNDVYGYKMSKGEIDKWLRMTENGVSANYNSLFK